MTVSVLPVSCDAEDRRSGLDRRNSWRDKPDRRRRGRPALTEDQRQQTIHVKLPPKLHDWLCRAARRQNSSVNAIVRQLVERAADLDAA